MLIGVLLRSSVLKWSPTSKEFSQFENDSRTMNWSYLVSGCRVSAWQTRLCTHVGGVETLTFAVLARWNVGWASEVEGLAKWKGSVDASCITSRSRSVRSSRTASKAEASALIVCVRLCLWAAVWICACLLPVDFLTPGFTSNKTSSTTFKKAGSHFEEFLQMNHYENRMYLIFRCLEDCREEARDAGVLVGDCVNHVQAHVDVANLQ